MTRDRRGWGYKRFRRRVVKEERGRGRKGGRGEENSSVGGVRSVRSREVRGENLFVDCFLLSLKIGDLET